MSLFLTLCSDYFVPFSILSNNYFVITVQKEKGKKHKMNKKLSYTSTFLCSKISGKKQYKKDNEILGADSRLKHCFANGQRPYEHTFFPLCCLLKAMAKYSIFKTVNQEVIKRKSNSDGESSIKVLFWNTYHPKKSTNRNKYCERGARRTETRQKVP